MSCLFDSLSMKRSFVEGVFCMRTCENNLQLDLPIISLISQMELTLQELHTGIKPTRIPDLDKVLQHIKEGAQDPEE